MNTLAFALALVTISQVEAPDPADFVAGPVELVTEGYQFTEGPVWIPDEQRLLFSDIPADTIFDHTGEVFREPSNNANGLILDTEGRLIACEHGARRVTRTEPDGSITVLADNFEGRRLNSPNDAIVRSDGAIFFTDPPYGVSEADRELDFSGVYVIRPDGELVLLADDFDRPNGLALSRDERTLYVADTREHLIRAYDVAEDGSLSNARLFTEIPNPDGMDVDAAGRVWTAGSDGIQVNDPDGTVLFVLEVPQHPANCAFGGEDGKTLYITARSALYSVPVHIRGVRFPLPEEEIAVDAAE